jgi:DNA-binding beta-propeller fold protein YncE
LLGSLIGLPAAAQSIGLAPLSTYETGAFDEGAAEIVAYDPGTRRLYFVNAFTSTIDVLGISDPANPAFLFSIDVTPYGDQANSVAVYDGLVAAAVENDDTQAPGSAVFLDADGNFLNALTVGALPDMITFTLDGSTVLVANEGKPDGDYLVDPEGSVSIISVAGGVAGLTDADVRTAGFTAFNGAKLDESIRIFGPGATVAQDLGPEYSGGQ